MSRTSMKPKGKDDKKRISSFSSYQRTGIYSVVLTMSSRNSKKAAANAAISFFSISFPLRSDRYEKRMPQNIPENRPAQRKQNGKSGDGERDGS